MIAYIITSECVNCGLCIDSCPVSAIIDGGTQYLITKSCIGCGKCAKLCPVEAVKQTNK